MRGKNKVLIDFKSKRIKKTMLFVVAIKWLHTPPPPANTAKSLSAISLSESFFYSNYVTVGRDDAYIS